MPSSVFPRATRRIAGLERPLAAALPVDGAHVDAIEQSHQRCASIGLSRLQSPDYSPQGRADLAITRERNRRLHPAFGWGFALLALSWVFRLWMSGTAGWLAFAGWLAG